MIRALLIGSLFVCQALGLSVVQPCLYGEQDEVLKQENGQFFGSSLKIGPESDGRQRVSWETASAHFITGPYTHNPKTWRQDSERPTIKFDYTYGLEPAVEFNNGFDTVQMAGCPVKDMPIAETGKDVNLHSVLVGGLRPDPHMSSHELLGSRSPRISFCFPQDKSMDGRLVWGAPDTQIAGASELRVTGGLKAHHWAVNVTGMSMFWRGADGKPARSILDEHREEVAKDPKAYWIAVFSTGQQTLVVPKEVLAEMQKHLDTSNLVDCADTSKMPSLSFELDGVQHKIHPEHYLSEVSSYTNKQVLQELPLHFRPKLATESQDATHGKCVMLFAPPTPFNGVFVLGQPFLRNFATKFDFEKRVITTVQHEGSCWSGASRSHNMVTYVFLLVSLAMSLSSVF